MQKLRNVRKKLKNKKGTPHLYKGISYKHASQILQILIFVTTPFTKLRERKFCVIL